ncbi:glycosyltransferase family 2 protein [Pseudooceanicola aestuarii]|uniref:glycosyltransferase family 2 protein n=1 Tax=Pseudooceanicola aestuarii TaxID=2697319 RepID=UPI0013D1D84F|nr:glycosyltransferase family A protein [Pseudooceanicola aestuarii]
MTDAAHITPETRTAPPPAVTIVLPCGNDAETILDTLESLSLQTFTDWEAICVDDGATDGTPVLIATAAQHDPRIRLLRNPGQGLAMARNSAGLDHARGGLVAFCAPGDLWQADKLARLVQILADPAIDAAYGRVGLFAHTPADTRGHSPVAGGDLTIDRLLGDNPVCSLSNLTLRREVLARSYGFDTTIPGGGDLEWMVRLVGGGARVVGDAALHGWCRACADDLAATPDNSNENRRRAIETAACFGVTPSLRSRARHRRHLAHRAHRLGLGRAVTLHHAVIGMLCSPVGFLGPLRPPAPGAIPARRPRPGRAGSSACLSS